MPAAAQPARTACKKQRASSAAAAALPFAWTPTLRPLPHPLAAVPCDGVSRGHHERQAAAGVLLPPQRHRLPAVRVGGGLEPLRGQMGGQVRQAARTLGALAVAATLTLSRSCTTPTGGWRLARSTACRATSATARPQTVTSDVMTATPHVHVAIARSMPETEAMLRAKRPERYVFHWGLGTLSHYGSAQALAAAGGGDDGNSQQR